MATRAQAPHEASPWAGPPVAPSARPFDAQKRDAENAWDGTPHRFHKSFVGRPPTRGPVKGTGGTTGQTSYSKEPVIGSIEAFHAGGSRPATALSTQGSAHHAALTHQHESLVISAHQPLQHAPTTSSTFSQSFTTHESVPDKRSRTNSMTQGAGSLSSSERVQHLTLLWGTDEGPTEVQISSPSSVSMTASRLQLKISVPNSPGVLGPDSCLTSRSPNRLHSPSVKFRTMHQSKSLKTSPSAMATKRSRPPPPDLVTKEDIPDDDMRQLFKEVQELSQHSSVSEALKAKQDLKQLYARYSQRYTHLPCALVASVNQDLAVLPLPGPRGVQGYMVDHQGRVLPSRKRMIGPYLAATENAMTILDELRELESGTAEPCYGLEGDPELVKLWISKGGSPSRHEPFLPKLGQRMSKVGSTPQAANFITQTINPRTSSIETAGGTEPGNTLDRSGRQHSGRLSNQASLGHEPARQRSIALPTTPSMEKQSSLPSPAVMLQPKQQRRVAKRAPGQTISGLNPVSGQPLGFYLNYVKGILEMGQPDELAPAQQVAFRTESPPNTTKGDGMVLTDGSDTEDFDPSAWDAWDSSSEENTVGSSSPGASVPSSDSTAVPNAAEPPASVSIFATPAAQSGGGATNEQDLDEARQSLDERDQQEVEAEAAKELEALEAAWKLVQQALAVGRRTKMKSRPTTSPQKRAAHQQVALLSSRSVAPGSTWQARDGSIVASAQESSRQQAQGSSSQVQDVDDSAAQDAVQGFIDAWTNGKTVGEMQVMSIARLKEVLLEMDETVLGTGKLIKDPSKWKEKLAAWIPSQEEQDRLIKLMGAAPTLHIHKHIHPVHVLKPWLSPELVQRAHRPGSTITLPEPPTVAPELQTQRRYITDTTIQKGEHLQDSVGLSGEALCRRLQQLTSCGETELDLGLVSRVSRADMGIVYQALQTGPAITCLKACNNLLDAGSVQGLLALLGTCTTLKSLDISNTTAFSDEAGDALGNLLHPRHKLNLTHLNLHGCPITDEGFHSLALGIQFNKVLIYLDLSKCGLTDDGLAAMDAVLEQNIVLLDLIMSDNHFTAKGVTQLFKDLKGNVALTYLELRSCGLDDECAAAIAQALPKTIALQELDLSDNHFSHVGAAHLGVAISQLETPQDGPVSRPHRSSTANMQSSLSASSFRAASLRFTQADSSRRVTTAGGVSRRVTTAGAESRRVTTAGAESRRVTTAGAESTRVTTAGGELARQAAEGDSSLSGMQPGPTWVGRDGCCPLHTLLLHGNPLGMAGITHLLQGMNALQGGPEGSPLTILGVDGTEVPVTTPTSAASNATRSVWDPALPCGTYCLDLGNTEQKQVASTLVAQGMAGQVTWLSAKLNGSPLGVPALPPASWAKQLPVEGIMLVKVLRCNTVPPTSPVASQILLKVLSRQLRLSSTQDMQRLQMITCLCSVTFVTSQMVADLLTCFEYPHARVAAAAELLACCTDAHRLLPALLSSSSTHNSGELKHMDEDIPVASNKPKAAKHGVLTSGEVSMLLNQHPVQAWKYTPERHAASSWLQLVACGQYKLDLGHQAQRLLASCILGLSATVQQHVVLSGDPANSASAAQAILSTWSEAVHVGLLNSVMRNVKYQGKPVEPLPCQISSLHLPHSGILELDLNLPHLLPRCSHEAPHLPAPAQPGSRAVSPLSPSFQIKQLLPDELRLSDSGSKAAALAASTRSFCVGANTDARPTSLQRLASMNNAGRMAVSLSMFRSSSIKSTGLTPAVAAAVNKRAAQSHAWMRVYQQCLCSMGIASHDVRIQGWQKATDSWAADAYLSLLNVWRQNAVLRFEQLAAEQHKQQEAVQEPEAAPAANAKGKGKAKGKAAGKQGKVSKEAARAAALVAELRANREAAALQAATGCLDLMNQFVMSSDINAVQVLYLLQLLPSMQMRLALLTRVRPALLDSHHMLDLTLCLTTPCPLSDGSPMSTPEPFPTATSPDSTSHLHSSMPGMGQMDVPDRPMTPTLPGAKGLWMSPRLDVVLPALKPARGQAKEPEAPAPVPGGKAGAGKSSSGKASKAKASEPQAPEPAVVTSSTLGLPTLMQLVSDQLGLKALNLVWAAPESLQAFLKCLSLNLDESEEGLVLDMNSMEQQQLAMQVTRWCDLARGASIMSAPLQTCWTDAGQLPLEHEGTWSYWEQVLGWLCSRALAAVENTPIHALPNATLLPSSLQGSEGDCSAPSQQSAPAVVGAAGSDEQGSSGTGKLGKLQMVWTSSQATRRHAAALAVQAVWRGWRARRGLALALAEEAQTVTDACVVGSRIAALPEHLLLLHLPAAAPPAVTPTLTTARISMDSDVSSEPEFVQPLTPLYMAEPPTPAAAPDTPRSGLLTRLGSRAPSMRLNSCASYRMTTPPMTQRRKAQFSLMGRPQDVQPLGDSDVNSQDEVDWQDAEHAAWAKAVHKWQATWAQLKFWLRVKKLESLAGPIQRRHALREMSANAAHLFPLPPTVPAQP